jgi:hypothetical protein
MLGLVLASVALCAATWGACHWWYGRRIADALLQFDKAEKGRQLSIQQTMQARKQIERLQKELAAQHRSTMPAAGGSSVDLQLQAVLRAGDTASTARRLPATGFADTEPMLPVHRV